MRGVWIIAIACACGSGHSQPSDAGFGNDGFTECRVIAGEACNVLDQTGCCVGDKCTWFVDAMTPPIGHFGCAPMGMTPTDQTCAYGVPGTNGYDDCIIGDVCDDGICRAICDVSGQDPTCAAGDACAARDTLFGPISQPKAAGVCEPICDPLADNDLLGSGERSGSSCSAGFGCYGLPTSAQPTHWTCEPDGDPSLVHRSTAALVDGVVQSNGCAEGYIPVLYDSTGSMQLDCVALCAPGNTYAGNPGTQYPAGQAPHACNTTDARGVFDPATTTNDGDHCMYSWRLEIDPDTKIFVRSPTSDTVGLCVDHSKYRYDSNGDGTIDDTDAVWPLCADLPPGFGSAGVPGGGDFGCVDTAHVLLPFTGKAPRFDLRVRASSSIR